MSAGNIFEKMRNYRPPYCKDIIEGNSSAIENARQFMKSNPREKINDSNYIQFIESYGCDTFRRIRGYRSHPTSEEEREFPLAFGMLIYTDLEQVERFLRAIYMPQNYYCIHIDKKAKNLTRTAITKISSCFPNVFLSSKSYDVRWGQFSVLQADITCPTDLLRIKDWKYFFNLAGQEFPLMSNRQLVRMVKAYSGANDNIIVKASDMFQSWKARTQYVFKWKGKEFWPRQTNRRKSAAPHGIRVRRGELHLIASRKFIEYIIRKKEAKDFLNWLRDTNIPDESFYSTLTARQAAICVPGAYNESDEAKPITSHTRWKHWTDYKGSPKCHGKIVRLICIPGIEDLSRIIKDNTKPIINKLYINFEYLTFDCLEDYVRGLQNEANSISFQFNDTYFKQLNHVKYRNTEC
ncbi:beta-1,3-galactosyl-O-glycosyl-glycoprotein beta-1,6-N-acetylglucosaminyltransferase 3-like [Tubulanus polymorphus]|uniref:beta-1,3-galactosyl-O-glycosyl-glycoprotein beta-1,6-N-acetylglucosaminyltransferase 3-like n=1 Tax=Tubulanus polymorphus TaxID=672921 RepID=UPI003DA1D458